MKYFILITLTLLLSFGADAKTDGKNNMVDTIKFDKDVIKANTQVISRLTLNDFNIEILGSNEMLYHGYTYKSTELVGLIIYATKKFPTLDHSTIGHLFLISRNQENYVLRKVFTHLAEGYMRGDLDKSIISLQAKIMNRKRYRTGG
jgi:hypothetical protein